MLEAVPETPSSLHRTSGDSREGIVPPDLPRYRGDQKTGLSLFLVQDIQRSTRLRVTTHILGSWLHHQTAISEMDGVARHRYTRALCSTQPKGGNDRDYRAVGFWLRRGRVAGTSTERNLVNVNRVRVVGLANWWLAN